MQRIIKDPQARLDYGFDWTDWLKQENGTVDVISNATWAVTGPDSSLVSSSPYIDAKTTGVWLTGGTVGSEYVATCHITTAAGRQDDRSLKIGIEQR